MSGHFDVAWVREQFPGLARRVGDQAAVFFDGPAGSQVPQRVIDAVAHYLAHTNANLGGAFATSVETGQMLRGAQEAVADLLGASSADEVVFGPSMTALTFALSQAVGQTWRAGDEIVLSRLEHDANVTPWVMAAEKRGVRVHHVGFDPRDCTLDLQQLGARLGERTRLVAVGAASNLSGSITEVARVAEMARAVGAQLFVDAVHFAPHRAMEVQAWDCDFLCCSAYKFFGPHVGVLWGREELLRSLPVAKLRPASDELPDRWSSGTPNLEGIAGTQAAVEYIAELGRRVGDAAGAGRRAAIVAAFDAIGAYEQALCQQLLEGLDGLKRFRVWGITRRDQLNQRTPTVFFTHAAHAPQQIARALAEQGIFVWAGNNYALPVTEALGLEPAGGVRVGLLHYNTGHEVARLLERLAALA